MSDYIILNNNSTTESVNNAIIDDPLQLSKNLQRLMLKLKGENLVDEKSIDYLSLAKNTLFKNDYINLTRQLKHIDLTQLIKPRNDHNLLAFFINIYNALTIHAITYLHETDSNLKESSNASILSQSNGKFWSRMAYIIGTEELVFSLDDIEHGILRANRVHPSRNQALFGQNDKRLKYSVDSFDPRIHFALNCGAKGCPPIAFYTSENLERGLNLATVNFVTSETKINLEQKTVELSRLFLWYKLDFVNAKNEVDQNEQLIKFIYENLRDGEQTKEDLKHLIESNGYDRIKIEFSTYDWQINSKN